MKRQKRFKTEEELLEKIDELHRQKEFLGMRSIEAERVVKESIEQLKALEAILQSDGSAMKEELQEQAEMLRCKISVRKKESEQAGKARLRIENSTLPKHKEALAAFRTITLPGISEDKSVVLA